MEILNILGIPHFKNGSGIHIKKENRGKFTEYCDGKVTQECIDKAKKSNNPTLKKRAVFAENARVWKHQKGGYIVKSGDTLSQIAKATNTTVDALKKLNNLTSDKIKVGQSLVIPSSDRAIGDSENYGWAHPTERGAYDKNRLRKTIDPGTGFTWGSYITNGARYALNMAPDYSTAISTRRDQAFFDRHIGFPRDYDVMPVTQVRFSGDFNEDGTPKFPNAEYVGIDETTKDFIRDGMAQGYITTDQDGFWTPKKEKRRDHEWTSGTSHFGSYAIRENNGSGIYDVFDTYDFDQGIANRLPGYQIEIRDTIHGPNANPKLYDKNFSTKKAEQRKKKRQENNTWVESIVDFFK